VKRVGALPRHLGRSWFIIALAALLLVLGTIAGACDGGGGRALEEYFQRIESVLRSADDDFGKLVAEFEEAVDEVETEEGVTEAFRAYSRSADELYADVVADLESIDPPSDVEDAHEEFVAAETAGRDMFEELNEQAQRAESASDMEEWMAEFGGPEVTAVSNRSDQACLALQVIADDNGVDVDLECEEDVVTGEEDETASPERILPSPRPAEIPREGHLLGSADAPVTVIVYADF
jgi:hypothetical protein